MCNFIFICTQKDVSYSYFQQRFYLLYKFDKSATLNYALAVCHIFSVIYLRLHIPSDYYIDWVAISLLLEFYTLKLLLFDIQSTWKKFLFHFQELCRSNAHALSSYMQWNWPCFFCTYTYTLEWQVFCFLRDQILQFSAIVIFRYLRFYATFFFFEECNVWKCRDQQGMPTEISRVCLPSEMTNKLWSFC